MKVISFKKGLLPLKYLHMPVKPCSLTSSERQVLTEGTPSTIRVWLAKKLSYAGQVHLINLKLSGISSYWSQMFLIPRIVLHGVVQQSRSFL